MKHTLIAVVALLIGCNSSTSPTETQDLVSREFTLRYGQSANIAGTPLKIRFAELAEESRCPRSVVCAWAGNAKIGLEVTANGRTDSVFLNTAGNPPFPREATVFGYTIRLIDVLPYPEEPKEKDPTGYSARLQIVSSP